MTKTYEIESNTYQTIIDAVEVNKIIPIIGENMSGKTVFLRDLRNRIKNQSIDGKSIILHIEVPLNKILITQKESSSEEIRIEELFKLLSKIASRGNVSNNEDSYNLQEKVIQLTNQSLKSFGEISIRFETISGREQQVRNPLEKILRILLNTNNLSTIDEQDIQKWSHEVEMQLNESLDKYNFRKIPLERIEDKAIHINFEDRTEVKLTQGSSGLGVLVALIFTIELISEIKNVDFYLFVDELELFLHPAWQIKILEYINNKIELTNNMRIIYTTHSPHLIPTEKLSSINIVEYKNGKITVENLLSKIKPINTRHEREMNVLKPIEKALGFDFNILSAPFLTVEGEEELDLFYHIKPPSVAKIINLKGSGNLIPYVVIANNYKTQGKILPALFILDADVNLNDYKNIENKVNTIRSLKDHFLFIGKSIYTFDELYPNDIYPPHKQECLEDFLEANIFKSNYKTAKDAAIKILRAESNEDLSNLENIIQNQDSFSKIIGCIKSSRNRLSDLSKDVIDNKIPTKIKREILNAILNDKEYINCIASLFFEKINLQYRKLRPLE